MIMKRTKFFGMMLFALALATTACTNVNDPDPDPTSALPFSETFETGMGNFTSQNVSGDQAWEFSAQYKYLSISGFVTPTNFANEDWLISPEIDLAGVTAAKLSFDHVARYFADLKNEATVWVSSNYVTGLPSTATWAQLPTKTFTDPGNWTLSTSGEISLTAYAGKKINIAFKYISTATKAGTWEIKNFKVAEGEAVIDPADLVSGEGTEASPYNVAGGIANQGASKWVKGYIVGYVVFGTPTVYAFSSDTCTVSSNILIAGSKTETDINRCMAVQLPSGSAVQTGLNLKDVKANLGKEVTLYGSLEAYFGKPGLKNTSYYVLEGGTTGGTKPVLGDFEVPEMTIAELRTQWTGTLKTITDKKKIVGVVITDLVGGNSGSLKNLTIASTDNSAGIMVRLTGNNTYSMGDKIEISVEGLELNHYGLAIQLNNVPNTKTQKIGTATITPKVTTIANVKTNYASLESTLVTVTGTITSPNGFWGSATANQNNTLTSGADALTLYVAKYSTFVTTAIPTGEKTVTGIVGQYTTVVTSPVYQLIVRNLNDVK